MPLTVTGSQPYAAEATPVAGKPSRRKPALETVWAVLLIGLTIFSAVTTALMRPLWYDEIGTATVSGLQSFPKIWAALLNAADAQPPAFFWVTVLSRRSLPSAEFGLRFPAIVGFTIFAICIYLFTRRAWGGMVALVALLVLMCSEGLYYASEARPYGLLLGCLGIAALLWQIRKHGNRSPLTLLGFLAALAALCAFHYYGVFVLAVFALVEIALALVSHKPDWAVLSGLPLCAAPIVFALPLIHATRREITAGFWGRPSLKSIVEGSAFPFVNLPLNQQWTLFRLHGGRPIGAGNALTLLLIIAAGVFCGRMLHLYGFSLKAALHAPAELLLATGLLLLPAIAGLAAMIALGGYTARYTIGAIAGTAILAAWFASRLGRGWSLAIAAMLTLEFGAIQSPHDIHNLWAWLHGATPSSIARERLGPLYRLVDNGTPVVVPDGHLFFESWYYARPGSRQKLVYLQSRPMAMRFSGSDSYDFVNERLKPYIDLRLENPGDWLNNHQAFFVARRGDLQPWDWTERYFDAAQARYQVVANGDDHLIVSRVTLPASLAGGIVQRTH